MSKKLFISLAPLVAIVAFAVMPVAAQATPPHWFKNNEAKPLTEGVREPTVTWGEATNLSQTSALGEINCRGVGGGIAVNPVGGGPGEGSTNSSSFYECNGKGCTEAAEKNKLPFTVFAKTDANEYPWHNELSGEPASQLTIGEPFTSFSAYGKPVNPKEIQALVTCETPPGFEPHVVAVAATFQGELKPFIGPGHNGTSATKPSKVQFKGVESGALHSEIAGEGTNSGNIKYLGYTSQALITAE